MSVATLLAGFAARGIHLRLQGEQLGYSAPPGALSDNDKAVLRVSREPILAYLRARAAVGVPTLAADASAAPVPSLTQHVWWRLMRATTTPLRMEKIALVLPVSGVTAEAAAEALHAFVARHHTLRSRFSDADARLSVSINPAEAFRVTVRIASDDAEAEAAAAAFVAPPLPVDSEWLARAAVFHVQGGRTILALVCHHIVFDATSMAFAAAELNDRLAGFPPKGEATQFLDYARWEKGWFEPNGQVLARWWSDWLAALPRLRSPSGRDLLWLPGARVDHPLPLAPDLSGRIEAAAVRLGVTPFIVILSAFARALGRWSGQSRFPIRSVGDLRASPELSDVVGLLICADSLEVDDPEAPLEELATRLATENASAMTMRLPTHAHGSGATYEAFHEQIAATINYFPAGAARIATRGPPIALPTPPNRPQVLPWPVPLPSVFLRLWEAQDGLAGRLEFSEAAVEPDEQTALVSAFLAAIEEVAA